MAKFVSDNTSSTNTSQPWLLSDNGHGEISAMTKILLINLLEATNVLYTLLALWAFLTSIVNVTAFALIGQHDRLASVFLLLSLSDGSLAALMLVATIGTRFDQYGFTGRIMMKRTVNNFIQGIVSIPVYVSMLINAVIAVVRCCCVVMPLKVNTIFTPRRQRAITLFFSGLIVLATVLLVWPMRFTWVTDPATNLSLIFFDTPAKQLKGTRLFYVDVFRGVVFYSTVGIAVVSMLFLIVSLRRSSHFRKMAALGACAEPGSRGSSFSTRRDVRVVKSVILILAIFILCNLPFMLFSMLRQILSGVTLTGHLREEQLLLYNVLACCLQLNSGLNIFVYFSFNTQFRTFITRSLFCVK